MPYISWGNSMSVGVKKFDEEHQVLINFVNKLHTGILAGDSIEVMSRVLEGLVDYTEIHFKHEEDYMILYEYSKFDDHKNEHEALVKKVLQFKSDLESGKANFSIELMSFLKDWLVNHIQGTDMQYKEFFKSKGAN